MHCLIIDDNSKTYAALEGLLEAMEISVSKAVQPYMVRSILTSENIDIIFIRVRLWDFNQFQSLNSNPVIIFLSGGKDKLTNKAETSVQYSFNEPFNEILLSHLIQKIQSNKQIENRDFFFLRYNGRFHKTMFRDIEMIERLEKNYTRFFLSYGAQFIPGTLPGWLSKLPNDRFIRISDNLIIPTEESFKITGDEYIYKGRKIHLTFRFASSARKEMEHWPDGL